MPNKGDKLYDVFNGELNVVTFIEPRYYSPDGKIGTYLVEEANGPRLIVSKEMYCISEKEAWEKYIRECENALYNAKTGMMDAENHYSYCSRQFILAHENLRKCLT